MWEGSEASVLKLGMCPALMRISCASALIGMYHVVGVAHNNGAVS